MSRRVRIATLSSVNRVLRDVVFTVPFRAAMICGPCIFYGIPGLSTLATAQLSGQLARTPHRLLCRQHSRLLMLSAAQRISGALASSRWALAMNLLKLQFYVKVLQSYSTLCTGKKKSYVTISKL